MNIGQMLVNTARRLPDRLAVSWGDRTLTYRQLAGHSHALALGLAGLGVTPGARASHPGVRDVAVVGVPDRTWGEVVTAVVVAHGAAPDFEPRLAAHCAATLAGYKRPRMWVFRADLPRNKYGKVLKRDLREELSREIGTEWP